MDALTVNVIDRLTFVNLAAAEVTVADDYVLRRFQRAFGFVHIHHLRNQYLNHCRASTSP